MKAGEEPVTDEDVAQSTLKASLKPVRIRHNRNRHFTNSLCDSARQSVASCQAANSDPLQKTHTCVVFTHVVDFLRAITYCSHCSLHVHFRIVFYSQNQT